MLSSNPSTLSSAVFFLCCLYLGGNSHRLVSGLCDTSATALTVAYGKSIPRTCINVPLGDDDDDKGRERCFYTYVPKSCNETKKAPLVVDVHGMGSCPLWSAGYTGWMQKAEEECFVVMWPNGNEHPLMPRCFNTPGFLTSDDMETESGDNDVTAMPCCCLDDTTFNPPEKAIDPLFLKMAIDTVIDQRSKEVVSIDTNRIYMAGHSNGCMMSLAMAALYSDTIAAVCCHAGAVLTPFDEDYTPVPIWMVHGMKDEIVPYEGNTMFELPGMGPLGFLSMNQTLSYLGDQNECSQQNERDVFDENGIAGKVYQHNNCKDQATVEVVALFGDGHEPYSSPVLGSRSSTIDTTAMAWDFCSAHTKGQEPSTMTFSEEKNYYAQSSSGSFVRGSFSMGLVLAPLFAFAMEY